MTDGWIAFFLVVGVVLTIFGGRILFSDKALDQMYKKGYWKDKSAVFDRKSGRRFDRYYNGGGIFLLGIVMIIVSVVAFLI
jgi:hypothetical protein